MNRSEFEARLKGHQFYHSIEVEPGLFTPGYARMAPRQDLVMRNLRSLSLAGKRVLDIGCRDGLFSFEAERLGAAEVVGVDNDLSEGATQLLIPYLKSRVRMHEQNLFDLTPDAFGTFDVIVCAGVLYHLRYPVHALRLIRGLLEQGGMLLLETAILSAWERYPLLYCPTADESPYEPTSVTFFNDHGMRSTLSSLGYEVMGSDHLYGRRLSSTKGVTVRHYLIAAALGVQRVAPGLVHRILGRFAIDRSVFVCRSGALDSSLAAYWDATHARYSAAGDQGSPSGLRGLVQPPG